MSDGAVGLLTTFLRQGDTRLLETLDTLIGNICFGEEVNDGGVGGELHGVSCVDELIIGQIRSPDVTTDHYVSWHTGDGVTTDLLRELTPVVHSLHHNTIMLTIGTLGSLATLCLAEVDDRLHCILGVDLNLVEDGGGAHGCRPLITL